MQALQGKADSLRALAASFAPQAAAADAERLEKVPLHPQHMHSTPQTQGFRSIRLQALFCPESCFHMKRMFSFLPYNPHVSCALRTVVMPSRCIA